MFRRFAIATIVAAALFGLVGLIGTGSQPSTDEAKTQAQGPVTVSDRNLTPVQGLKPLPEIIDFWQQRVDGNPVDYPSRTELGLALNTAASEQADLELYRQAEVVFTDAIDLNPDYDKARLGLASSLIAQHRFDEALAQIDIVEDAKSTVEDTKNTVEDTKNTVEDTEDSAMTLALLGDAKLGYGDLSGAADAYQRLIRVERSAPTVSRLARLRFEQGRPDEAVELATEALALSEELALRPHTQAFYRFQLGHFLFLNGDVAGSTVAYRDALAIEPEHGGASESLAFNLAADGDLVAAAEAYGSLIERSPAADLHGLYAAVLRQLGDERQAEVQEELGRAAALESHDDPAERRHLVGYHLTRNPAVAVELARADLAERQDSGAYDALAWALHHDGQQAEAVEMIEAALASGTKHPATLYHAAAIHHAAATDQETAARYLRQALAINPTFHPTEAADAEALARVLL